MAKAEKIIKFVIPMSPYRVDDCASFEPRMANKIIEAGFAVGIDLEDTKLEEE